MSEQTNRIGLYPFPTREMSPKNILLRFRCTSKETCSGEALSFNTSSLVFIRDWDIDGGGGESHKAKISFSEICIQIKNACCLKFFVLDDAYLGNIVNDISNELNLLPFRLQPKINYYLYKTQIISLAHI